MKFTLKNTDGTARRGEISPEELQEAVAVQQQEDSVRVLGQVLVSMNLVTEAELRNAVEQHIRNTILELIT